MKGTKLLIAALILNIAILVPVILSIGSDSAAMQDAFGPDSPARRILAGVYGAIALASLALIAFHCVAHPWAVPMTLALFSVQIFYKLTTVWSIGPSNPVLIFNCLVIVVQIIAVLPAWRAGSLSA